MATKDSITKNVVVASDHIPVTKKEDVEKVSSDDNTISKEVDVETEATIINVVVVASDNSEKQDKMMKKVVACDNTDRISEEEEHDKETGNDLVYKRPYCDGFLKFCFERFEVGIWSSAMEHNIGAVLINVMGELKSKLLFTWDQKQCTKTEFMCLDKKDKPVFLKELDHLWSKKYSNLPWCDGEYSATNTLLITDPVKALLNPPNTSISPGNYDPDNEEDDLLGPNGEIRVFLEGLAEAKDVQSYVKAHPIGDPAITTSHADWDYYSKIIRALGKKESSDH